MLLLLIILKLIFFYAFRSVTYIKERIAKV